MSTNTTFFTSIKCNERIPIVQKRTKECTLKCSYSYKYPTGYITSVKKPNYIRIYYNDTPNEPSVIYNRQGPGTLDKCKNKTLSGKFVVKEIRINYPCLHNWYPHGAKTAREKSHLYLCEINIYHTNLTGGADLMVSIPITLYKDLAAIQESSNKTYEGMNQINKIIDMLSKTGDRQTLSETFDLNKLIPDCPYYSYVAPEPTLPSDRRACGYCMNHIVFSIDDMMRNKVFLLLFKTRTKMLFDLLNTPNEKDLLKDLKVNIDDPLFDSIGYMYNKDGPSNKSITESDIWIECHPTGDSGELLIKDKKSDIMNIINLPVLPILTKDNLAKVLIIGLFIAVIFAVTMLLLFIIFYHIKKTQPQASTAK